MFRLYSGHYAQLRQAYERMIRFMEERREQTLDEIAEVSRTMGGEAVDAIQDGLAELMQEGAYEEMLEQLRNMHRSMEDYQPLVNRIVNAGRNMEKQFESDEYIASSLWSIGENDYDLIELDDTYANSINIGCTEIIELGKKLKYTMDNIVELCSGIVDLREEQEKVNAAYVLSQRMGNFQTCFNRYVYDIRDLEYNLSREFRGLTEEEPRIMGKAWETAQRQIITMQKALSNPEEADYGTLAEVLTQAVAEEDIKAIEKILNGCVDEHNGTMDYVMLAELESRTEGPAKEILKALCLKKLPNWNYADCMVEVKKEGGVLTILVLQDVLLEKDNTVKVTYDTTQENSVTGITTIACEGLSYPEEYYKIAEEFMSQDQNGEYTFERVLRADIDYCSDTDRKVLALLMEDKYRVIENADSREDREEQFEIVERMVESMYRYHRDSFGSYSVRENCVDKEWVDTLLTNLSDDNAGVRILLGKLPTDKCEWNTEYSTTYIYHTVTSGGETVDITITPHMVGLTFQVDYEKCNYAGAYEENSDLIYAPSEMRATAYIETLDEDTVEHLEEMGYVAESIVDCYMMADSVKDEGFIDNLMKAEYRDLFWTNPGNLGEAAKLLMPMHAARLVNIQDEHGAYTELEEFINEMFYQDEEHCIYANSGYYVDDYVKLMAEESGILRKNIVAAIYEDGITCAEADRMANMDNLWRTLYMLYSSGDLNFSDEVMIDKQYGMGKDVIKIDDIFIDEKNNIHASIMLCGSSGDSGYTTDTDAYPCKEFFTCPEGDPENATLAVLHNNVVELDAEINRRWSELPVDIAVEALGFIAPDIVTDGLKVVIELAKGSAGGTLNSILDLDVIRENGNGDVIKGLKFAGDLMKYGEKVMSATSELHDDKEKAIMDELTPWFYQVDKCVVDQHPQYLSRDICDYGVIKGIMGWNEHGFEWIAGQDGVEAFEANVAEIHLEENPETVNDYLMAYVTENEASYTQEEYEVLKFLIYGNNAPEGNPTSYESILDIEPQKLGQGLTLLDVVVEETIGKEDAIDYWQNTLEEIKNK